MSKELYVIKGMYKDQLLYFAGLKTEIMFGSGFEIKMFCKTINNAFHFSTIDEAEAFFSPIKEPNFKIYPVCPRCHKDYNEPPAISRKDNKTRICSECGAKEALYEFIKNVKNGGVKDV